MHLLDDATHPLRQRSPPRLAGLLYLSDPVLLQPGHHMTQGRALAGTFKSFNNDKFTRHQVRPRI